MQRQHTFGDGALGTGATPLMRAAKSGDIALVQQLLAKQPEERPANMAAVRAALLPWAGAAADKPLDQSGDTAFQAAIAALQTVP